MSQKIKIVTTKTNPDEIDKIDNTVPETENFSSPQSQQVKVKKFGFWKILGIILISLIFGGIGGVLAQKIIIPFVEQKLGKSGEIVVAEKTENVTVEESSATISAVKKVNPSVVSIVSTKNVSDIFGGSSSQQSAGTGFILTSDGLIITNKHVAGDKNAKYYVLTTDGKNFDATVSAIDPVNDIAVLKVNATNLPVVTLGDSNSLVPGQNVIAIGNALGEYQNSVTAGVVSGIKRSVVAGDNTGSSETIEGAIQTDAAINPGNSGGPLINIEGQVVGIDTAADQNGQTIGFAIPINLIKPMDTFIQNVREQGKIVRPLLGVRYIPINNELASLNNLPVSDGVLVYKGSGQDSQAVIAGSPAAEAGIKEGDIITAIDGQKIDTNHSLSSLIQNHKPGDEIELTILRDGKEKKVTLKLGEQQ